MVRATAVAFALLIAGAACAPSSQNYVIFQQGGGQQGMPGEGGKLQVEVKKFEHSATCPTKCKPCEQVAACRPDIMWVGISTPKQERFIAEHLAKLDVTLMAAVGAAFNFHAGRVQEAPRWVQRAGLQWFYRCLHEPRLWKRYGVIVPGFLLRAAAQLSGVKKYKLETA